MAGIENYKLHQCQHCEGTFVQSKYSVPYKACPHCRTPAALAAFGYGYEDIQIMTGISRAEARTFVFRKRETA